MPQRLGQHFLKNKLAINKIIAALDIKNEDAVIEIGPGKGALTIPLSEDCSGKNCKLIAIERDAELAKFLDENLKPANPNLQMVEGDALKVLPELISKLKLEKFKIVGNIPYYITGKLLRIISELEHKPELTVLMIQKEVAERIVAHPPKMNLLAAATQFWADPEIILKLKPADFEPAPEVDSAVIKLTTKSVIASPACRQAGKAKPCLPAGRNLLRRMAANSEVPAMTEKKYYQLIHTIFKQPRKTLLNNLRDGLDTPREALEKALGSINLPINARPQDLSIENIKSLLPLLEGDPLAQKK